MRESISTNLLESDDLILITGKLLPRAPGAVQNRAPDLQSASREEANDIILIVAYCLLRGLSRNCSCGTEFMAQVKRALTCLDETAGFFVEQEKADKTPATGFQHA